MNEQQDEMINVSALPQTPTVIKVMLVLTYISFGFQFIALVIPWIMKDFFYELEAQGQEMGQLLDMLENTQFMLVHLSALMLGLLGAIILWKMKKAGLYLYLAAKIILLTDVYVFGIQSFSVVGFIWSFIIWAIWPVVFIIHYKQMN
ncbi:MAG: hypothetical protein N2167_09520 [Flavobacteriales bacterium]|nr:hypothetical protein [Flavobacteriales bacterium]